MAKARLGAVTEKWINGKTERRQTAKTERPKAVSEKTKLTIYVSRNTIKTLWHNRAETGKPISHTVERLVTEGLEQDKEKE
ncbi:MAG: hypothetical protein CO036_03790 [Candidatus Omnitrophica bacterium CG_4_9_14_0_2_um_filter_43_12]|nr:MAG: hypothetical protein CO036_03790 [Candidatus Omnitrophica bacterium CG_4_9_14_0_2_um_filter_43_12]